MTFDPRSCDWCSHDRACGQGSLVGRARGGGGRVGSYAIFFISFICNNLKYIHIRTRACHVNSFLLSIKVTSP